MENLLEFQHLQRTINSANLLRNSKINMEKVDGFNDYSILSDIFTSTNLKDFSRNFRKLKKSPKCEKVHICKVTECAFKEK